MKEMRRKAKRKKNKENADITGQWNNEFGGYIYYIALPRSIFYNLD